MKTLNKIIIYFLLGGIALGLFVPITSAKTQIKEWDQKIRANYQVNRQQYLNEVNSWKDSRQQLLRNRTSYGNLQSEDNKISYEGQARNFLEATVDVLVKKLGSLKNWVSNRRALPEDKRQTIIAKVNQDISWLEDRKPQISTASSAQIKGNAKEILEYWKNHQVSLKRTVGQAWEARLTWTIGRFESTSQKVAKKIKELKTAGKDTSQLEVWLDDFDQKIEIAKEKHELAKNKYGAISNPGNANRLFKEANQLIRDANKYLRDAYAGLKEIIGEMKRLSGE